MKNKILQWFLEKHDLQLAVSTEMLKQQPKVAITKTKPGFKASHLNTLYTTKGGMIKKAYVMFAIVDLISYRNNK